MKNISLRQYKSFLLTPILIVILLSSCSKEGDQLGVDQGSGSPVSLSISLNSSGEDSEIPGTRLVGDPVDSESEIYSLEVLIFKSADGSLDGYKSLPRQIVQIAGRDGGFDTEYKLINEIKEIPLTAGLRDIYVIANAPDNHFSSIRTLSDFNQKMESLSTQGPYVLGSTGDPGFDPGIGGIIPSDQRMNLTMSSCMKNVQFNNQSNKHYLGYTTNGGRPQGVSTGHVLNGTNPFLVERIVARVALLKATFELPQSMTFEVGFPTSVYTYQLDSIFLVNAKVASSYSNEYPNTVMGSFGHGSQFGYNYLNSVIPSTINSTSSLQPKLSEPVSSRNYDITINDSPLWFYVFENTESDRYPTYMIIGARFNFQSTKDGTLKTVKCYYPVVINDKGTDGGANHNFIKRNNQYGILMTIKGLGKVYSPSAIAPLPSRSSNQKDDAVQFDVVQKVGQNIFPWTGNTYK